MAGVGAKLVETPKLRRENSNFYVIFFRPCARIYYHCSILPSKRLKNGVRSAKALISQVRYVKRSTDICHAVLFLGRGLFHLTHYMVSQHSR